jgi:circadian clock protein KaiC
MSNAPGDNGIEKLQTGIAGFDLISLGGLPKGRTTLVAGTADSAKTVMATEFLAAGLQNNERGLYFGFEESREQLFRNAGGWGIDFLSESRFMTFPEFCPVILPVGLPSEADSPGGFAHEDLI